MKLQEITGEFINLQEITGDILKIQEFTGVYRITGGLGGLNLVYLTQFQWQMKTYRQDPPSQNFL